MNMQTQHVPKCDLPVCRMLDYCAEVRESAGSTVLSLLDLPDSHAQSGTSELDPALAPAPATWDLARITPADPA